MNLVTYVNRINISLYFIIYLFLGHALPREKQGKNFSGTSFKEYVDKLNPFTWVETRADRLDAIFEVLNCIVEKEDTRICKIIVKKYSPLFQIENQNKTEIPVTTAKAVTDSDTSTTTVSSSTTTEIAA